MEAQNSKLLIEGASELGVVLTSRQIVSFDLYLRELKTWGEKINLIHRAGDLEIIAKDFLDSLTILKHLPASSSVADLGSGAGFPGLPAKIVRPDLRVALLESNRKKVYFLRNVVRLLGLRGIEVHLTEGEKIRPKFEPLDLLISRAFGSLLKLAGIGEHWLEKGGILLAMKGKRGLEELEKYHSGLRKKGFEVAFLDRLRLPIFGHERVLIGLKKKECST